MEFIIATIVQPNKMHPKHSEVKRALNITLIANKNTDPYSSQELSIKTEGDVLIVLAKHETKAEGGQSFVSKQFEQRFSLPSGVKPEKISSSLSKVPFHADPW